ncbi:MAG: hypothetical protein NW703_08885 [Nitrospiraceae bacterium]
MSRTHLRPFLAQLRLCLVEVEAYGSAHWWTRELRTLGHEVRLIVPHRGAGS